MQITHLSDLSQSVSDLSLAQSTERISGQPELHREILPQQTKKKKHIVYVCLSVCEYMHRCASTPRMPEAEASDTPGAGVTDICELLYMASGSTSKDPNCWAISSAPILLLSDHYFFL